MSRDRDEILAKILACIEGEREFVEIRDCLENDGVFLDGLELRKIIAELVRSGILCREVKRNRVLFYRCGT